MSYKESSNNLQNMQGWDRIQSIPIRYKLCYVNDNQYSQVSTDTPYRQKYVDTRPTCADLSSHWCYNNPHSSVKSFTGMAVRICTHPAIRRGVRSGTDVR